ncbi:MAG: DUF2889 domain-containing protein [Alphaproteobacteria bacterium]|nr:DUF2889 domain-containing protein [Alphaproteobacteria bacterium]
MALSAPIDREPLHARKIILEGFRRSDGLFDIEAELTDTKMYKFSVGDRGQIDPGQPLHRMRIRLTIDQGLAIVGAEAETVDAPFSVCPGGAETFGRLIGLHIRAGFLKEASARIGGIAGCTHIRELLQQIATVAIQTTYVLPQRQRSDADAAKRMIDSCFAYAADGPVVRRRWPHLAR